MKKLTCRDLGGACDTELTGETFLDIGKQSHAHVVEQIKNGDTAHMQAAEKMMHATPEQLQEWMEGWQRAFENAPTL